MTTIDLKKNPTGMHLWVEREGKRHATILKEALTEVFEDTPVVPGITKGGSRIRGTIPYDTRTQIQSLARSLHSSNGRRTQFKEDSWKFIIRSLKPGDHMAFVWTAKHAELVHNGANGVPGTFWATIMAQKLPWLIDAAAKRHPSK